MLRWETRRPAVLALLAGTVTVAVLGVCGTAPAATRPSDPGPGVYGIPGYQVPQEPPVCREHVCVHWVSTTQDAPRDLGDLDGDGLPDGVVKLADAFERAWGKETAPPPDGLGWRVPVGDGDLGGDGRGDAYVIDLRNNASGVAPRDADQARTLRPHGFVLVDEGFVVPNLERGVAFDLVPHELAHLVQYAYDGYFESWHAEATAEWMAAETDPSPAGLNPNARGWSLLTADPLVARRLDSGRPPAKGYYGAIWLRWLAQRYGRDAVRAVWEDAAERSFYSFHPQSVDAALAGRSSFAPEFAAFAAANAEWRLAGSGFGDTSGFPDVERKGTLTAGGPALTPTLDHTSFALFDVPVPTGPRLEVRFDAPAGTDSALALIGRVSGRAEVASTALRDGGTGSVGFPNPARFERITAVVVNADAELANGGRKDASGQWVFARDQQPYSLSATAPAAAGPATPSPDTTAQPADGPTPQASGAVTPPVLDGFPRAGLRADRTPPRVRIVSVARRAAAAPRRARLVITASEVCTVRLEIVVGGRIVARRSVRVRRGRQTIGLNLPARTARRRAAVRLRAVDRAGNLARSVRIVRLR